MTRAAVETRPAPPVSNARLALTVFLGSWSMAFLAGIGAFIVVRGSSADWPPRGLPAPSPELGGSVLGVLVAGSIVLHLVARALRQGRELLLTRGLATGFVLGVASLAVLGVEWSLLAKAGLHLSTGLYGNFFYALTGFHGLHVVAGLLLLSIAWLRAVSGRLSANRPFLVDACAMYWDFLSVIWLALLAALYLR